MLVPVKPRAPSASANYPYSRPADADGIDTYSRPSDAKNFEKVAQINTRLQIIEADATRTTSNASVGYPTARKAFIEHQLKEIAPLQP